MHFSLPLTHSSSLNPFMCYSVNKCEAVFIRVNVYGCETERESVHKGHMGSNYLSACITWMTYWKWPTNCKPSKLDFLTVSGGNAIKDAQRDLRDFLH